MANGRKPLLSAVLFLFFGMFITFSLIYVREQTTNVGYSIGPLECSEKSNLLKLPVNLNVNCDRWNRLSNVVKNCIATKLVAVQTGELWSNMSSIVETCGYLVQQLLNTTFLRNKDDLKGFVGNHYN